MEETTREDLVGDINRRSFNFKEDKDIPGIFRTRLSDYKKSSYDRGYMAAAANHKSDKNSMKETFLLSNVCPQEPSFNRGYWAKLEKHIRQIVRDNGRVSVITGPLLLSHQENDDKRYVTYEVIGDSEVAVPTHFFKVIKGEGIEESYILPNRKISKNKSLGDFRTTIEKIERVSGLLIN